MSQHDMHTMTASEIVRSIASGEASAEQVALSFLKRAEQLNPSLGAFVALDRDYVLSQAREIDREKRPAKLRGVPVGVKDVINTFHYPTQKGSPAWKGYKAGNDARCVFYLRQERAIVFGKTDTAELAVHAFGNAKNPHDPERVTGTSSGGSAAAVAAGMVPAALGTQTGGSIIRPASWCGVYAMKPSFGLIPRTGVLKTTDTLDSIGVFGRSVGDLGIMFDSIRIHGDNFPIQERNLARYQGQSRDKWRIGFVVSPFADQTEGYVLEAMENVRREVEALGAASVEVVKLELPKEARNFHDLHRRIYHPCLAYYLKNEHRGSPDSLSPVLKEIFEDAKTLPPEDYGVALNAQSELAARFEKFFEENGLDAIITNSSVGSAPVAEPPKHWDCNALWTMAWMPVINVPKFKQGRRPFGLQMVGPRYSDYRLLKLGQMLTERGVFPRSSEVVNPHLAETEVSKSFIASVQ